MKIKTKQFASGSKVQFTKEELYLIREEIKEFNKSLASKNVQLRIVNPNTQSYVEVVPFYNINKTSIPMPYKIGIKTDKEDGFIVYTENSPFAYDQNFEYVLGAFESGIEVHTSNTYYENFAKPINKFMRKFGDDETLVNALIAFASLKQANGSKLMYQFIELCDEIEN